MIKRIFGVSIAILLVASTVYAGPHTRGPFTTVEQLASVFVTGAASSTDEAIVRFDGITGKLIQGYTSNAPTISDAGAGIFRNSLTFTLPTDTDTSILLEKGGAATPAWAFTDDTGMGFFFKAANKMGISMGGSQRWELTSDRFFSNTTNGAMLYRLASTSTVPGFRFVGDEGSGLGGDGSGGVYLIGDGVNLLECVEGATDVCTSKVRHDFDGQAIFAANTVHNDGILLQFGGGGDANIRWSTNGTGEDLLETRMAINAGAGDTAVWWISKSLSPSNMTTWNDSISPIMIFVNDEGADSPEYAYAKIGPDIGATDVASAWYFDFVSGVADAQGDAVDDGTTTELGPIFRFGNAGSATTDHGIGAGSTLFEDMVEIDDTLWQDGLFIQSNGTVTCSGDACTYTAGQHKHYITSENNAGADVLTVSDGTVTHQRACFELITDGGDDVEITPTNFANGTKVTFDTAGESACFDWNGANWSIEFTFGGVVS